MRNIRASSLAGQQMKAAAAEAGLTLNEIAQRLEVSCRMIHRWWSGKQCPRCGKLVAYARLVGKPVSDLLGEEKGEEHDQPAGRRQEAFSDLLFQWAQRLMAGEEPGSAFDRIAGDPQLLTPRERQQLAAGAAEMRADLLAASEGEWARLTELDRRRILQQIVQITNQCRSGGATARGHSPSGSPPAEARDPGVGCSGVLPRRLLPGSRSSAPTRRSFRRQRWRKDNEGLGDRIRSETKQSGPVSWPSPDRAKSGSDPGVPTPDYGPGSLPGDPAE